MAVKMGVLLKFKIIHWNLTDSEPESERIVLSIHDKVTVLNGNSK